MVWIHGGGFLIGSGAPNLYGPQYFMDSNHEVILVTINYRLGALGFLNFKNEDITGNMGLRDQNVALKVVLREAETMSLLLACVFVIPQFVYDHIAAFGGDPNKITIFGESAGSMSVMAHILSKRSKGLFHQAIAQSGALNNLPVMFRPKRYKKENHGNQ